jgi:glycosyltransferase involved in cell wall biosynthesis
MAYTSDSAMSKHPAIAVIIPTYNRAHVISRALHSVLHQTYKDIQVIIVDDASTDNTEDILKEIDDPRVVYLRHEVRKGAAAARNTGIRTASSDYIAFQDSDDEWLCEKLEKQMNALMLASAEVGVVYTRFLRFENPHCYSFPPETVTKRSGDILQSLLGGNFITTQSVLVRKACFSKVGLFDENLPRLQDWELFIRLAKDYEFHYIDEPLLLATHTLDSISANSMAYPLALKIVLEKHDDTFAKNKSILAKQYYLLGKLACGAQNVTEGRKFFWKALRTDPLRVTHCIRIAATYFGPEFYRLASKLVGREISGH